MKAIAKESIGLIVTCDFLWKLNSNRGRITYEVALHVSRSCLPNRRNLVKFGLSAVQGQ